jgi:large subunit ribosomal protein L19e
MVLLQKRLAASVAGVGIKRVKIPPDAVSEVEDLQTRKDVKRLIREGTILILPQRGISNSRLKERRRNRRIKGEGRREGSRKGLKTARTDPDSLWVNRVRKMRRYLKWLRDNGLIDRPTYRLYYRRVKSGVFSSLSDLKNSLTQSGALRGK